MLNGLHTKKKENPPGKTIPSQEGINRLKHAQCPRDRVIGRQRSSQHGKRGATRAAAPEDGVGEREPPRRGGHERSHEHPVHGAGAEEQRGASAWRRGSPRRRRVHAGTELEWEAAWAVGSGGRERRSGRQ